MIEREERRLIRLLVWVVQDEIAGDHWNVNHLQELVDRAGAHLARPDRMAAVVEAARTFRRWDVAPFPSHDWHDYETDRRSLMEAVAALDAAEREAERDRS